jgi:hypothetical protein
MLEQEKLHIFTIYDLRAIVEKHKATVRDFLLFLEVD